MKKLLQNKSWKKWTTRKISFIYCLIMTTFIIIYTGILMATTNYIDTAAWISESLKQLRFIIGTGTLIVLLPFDALEKLLMSKVSNSLSDDEDQEE